MKYEVIIDLESYHIDVEAKTKEEAEKKAIKEYETKIQKGEIPMAEQYWVGECDEIKEEFEISIKEDGCYINDIKIKDTIFQKEKSKYDITEREDQVEHLIDWISEAKDSDKLLMKEDLKYLMSKEDKFIFSSISTNEYILKSDDSILFNQICKEILELNKVEK